MTRAPIDGWSRLYKMVNLDKASQSLIGQPANGSKDNHRVHFEARPCPDELDYTRCTREGDETNIYHWCNWAPKMKCQVCGATGFQVLEAVKVRKRNHAEGIFCPQCGCWMEIYAEISGPDQARWEKQP